MLVLWCGRRRDKARQFLRQLFGFVDQNGKTLRADISIFIAEREHDQGDFLIRTIAIKADPGLGLSAGLHELLQ